MNRGKIEKFFQVAIDKTKSGDLLWKRLSDTDERHAVHYLRPFPDGKRSFLSEHGTGRILLLARKDTNSISCYLLPDKDLSYQQLGNDNEPLLWRLYNVVYSQFLSVDSFIDGFISDFEDSSNPE